MSVVDALWGLNLIAGRARAVNAEFLLSGPVNHWLRGVRSKPPEPRYLLLTSPAYSSELARALRIGSRELSGPHDLKVLEGLILHVDIKGYTVTLLENPTIEGVDGIIRINVSEEAKRADVVLLEDYIIRLAPLSLEAEIWRWWNG